MSDALLVDVRNDILTLTINRPAKRNALNLALLDEIGESLAGHADDPDLKCAVITAAGDRCFAAGGDLKELEAIRTIPDARAMSDRGRRALDRVREFPLPVIGALNGLALGGGAELAMACDLRIAAAGAEIGFLQGRLNVTTAWGGGIDLVAAIGSHRALDLLLTARRIPASEALALGIVQRVADASAGLDATLPDFLEPWLARGTQSLRGFKSLTAARRMLMHRELRDVERECFVTAWVHDDHWRAVEDAAAARAGNPRKK